MCEARIKSPNSFVDFEIRVNFIRGIRGYGRYNLMLTLEYDHFRNEKETGPS